MATNEELEQRVKELESLIVAQYDPPTGPEYSFPAPGQPIDQDQFQLLSLHGGNGVIDRGGRPYWLNSWDTDAETNQKNSMILSNSTYNGKSEALVAGYYHVMSEERVVNFAPVLQETTYYVCLTFDPRVIDESGEQANGAISIQVYDSEPPSTFGRVHVILWTVTRKPNQLLSDATIDRVRPRLAPPLYVWLESHKPDPNKQLSGALCFVGQTKAVYRVSSDDDGEGSRSWVSLTDPPWTEPADSDFYGWAGSGHRRGYRRTGENSAQLRGRVKIMEDRPFRQGGGTNSAGYGILTLPADLTPQREQRFIASSSGYSGNVLNVVTVSSDGNVYGMPLLGDATWLGLDGIEYSLHE